MKCPKCGAPLPDGAKFCGSCGSKIEIPAAAPVKTVAVRKPTAPVVQPSQQAVAVEPDHGAAVKRKRMLPFLIAGVVLLLVVLAVVFFVLPHGGSGKNAYIVLQDGRYELLKDLGKGDMIEVAATKSDDSSSATVRFSSDGKYVYFLTKFNDNSYTGTLCRAEYGKLKANSSKNDQYITTIASNVRAGFELLKGDTILYQNDEYNLYYFDGKETQQIAKDIVGYYRIGDDSNEIIYTRSKDGDDDADLYYVSLDKPEDPVKIDSHVSNVILHEDVNDLVYCKRSDDDETFILYTAGLKKDPEKIASDIFSIYIDSENNRYFYAKNNGKTRSAYDFVNDPYKVTEEPSWGDFYNNGKYDDNGYNKAWEHYKVRQRLMGSEYDIKLFDIYCLEKDEPTLIAENIVSNDYASNGFIYWGEDAFEEGFDIDDIEYYSDVSSALSYLGGNASDVVDMTKLMVYNALTNQVSPLGSSQDDDVLDAIANGRLYLTADSAVLRNWDDDTLMKASINKGVLGDFSFLADSAKVQTVKDGVIYYTADTYDQGDNTYTDLYSFSKGESTRIAQDILADWVNIYEDGKVYVYTDASSRGQELTCIDKDGNKSVIADDVTRYFRADKSTLVYISDGDLYSYNGKEKNRIATDVDYIWASSLLKADTSIGLS